MKVDAIKRCMAAIGTEPGPSDADTLEAIEEVVDLALGFLGDVRRIADSVEAMNREGVSVSNA